MLVKPTVVHRSILSLHNHSAAVPDPERLAAPHTRLWDCPMQADIAWFLQQVLPALSSSEMFMCADTVPSTYSAESRNRLHWAAARAWGQLSICDTVLRLNLPLEMWDVSFWLLLRRTHAHTIRNVIPVSDGNNFHAKVLSVIYYRMCCHLRSLALLRRVHRGASDCNRVFCLWSLLALQHLPACRSGSGGLRWPGPPALLPVFPVYLLADVSRSAKCRREHFSASHQRKQ